MKFAAILFALLMPRIALAVMLPSLDVAGPEIDFPSLSVSEKSDPVVRLYVSDACPACDKLKDKLTCVPAIKFVECEPEDWVTSTPVLQWQGEDGRWWSMGNHGAGVDLQQFVKEFNGTNPSRIEVAFDILEAKDIGYPVRGNYWSVGSNWSPSRSQVEYHLLYSSQHAGKFSRSYLAQLDWRELQSLHSDDHENRVKWASVEKQVDVPKPQPTTERVQVKSYQAPERKFFRRRYRTRGCPSGSCPL